MEAFACRFDLDTVHMHYRDDRSGAIVHGTVKLLAPGRVGRPEQLLERPDS
jgi:hypothetical protein